VHGFDFHFIKFAVFFQMVASGGEEVMRRGCTFRGADMQIILANTVAQIQRTIVLSAASSELFLSSVALRP
tara:strand:- start:2202 stop:2414 length:213 start_codon:yes stop_codon:yes gene_type:complete